MAFTLSSIGYQYRIRHSSHCFDGAQMFVTAACNETMPSLLQSFLTLGSISHGLAHHFPPHPAHLITLDGLLEPINISAPACRSWPHMTCQANWSIWALRAAQSMVMAAQLNSLPKASFRLDGGATSCLAFALIEILLRAQSGQIATLAKLVSLILHGRSQP